MYSWLRLVALAAARAAVSMAASRPNCSLPA
jgi:hypothetical protein